jgi:hypothetical protein
MLLPSGCARVVEIPALSFIAREGHPVFLNDASVGDLLDPAAGDRLSRHLDIPIAEPKVELGILWAGEARFSVPHDRLVELRETWVVFH